MMGKQLNAVYPDCLCSGFRSTPNKIPELLFPPPYLANIQVHIFINIYFKNFQFSDEMFTKIYNLQP